MRNGFKTTFAEIADQLDCTPLMEPLTTFHHHRQTCKRQKALSGSRNYIQSP